MSYEGGNLILTFVDWRERSVRVTFRGVCRFEWSDEPDDYFDGEPHDRFLSVSVVHLAKATGANSVSYHLFMGFLER